MQYQLESVKAFNWHRDNDKPIGDAPNYNTVLNLKKELML